MKVWRCTRCLYVWQGDAATTVVDGRRRVLQPTELGEQVRAHVLEEGHAVALEQEGGPS